MTRRTERMASQLLGEVAQLLRQEVSDPRVGLVTLTRADVAPDLSNAVVFWSALDIDGDPEKVEACQLGLESAAPFLRKRLSGRLPLRRMPALRFRYDPSLALGSHTLSLIHEVAPVSASDPDAGGADEAGAAEESEARGERGNRQEDDEDGAQE